MSLAEGQAALESPELSLELLELLAAHLDLSHLEANIGELAIEVLLNGFCLRRNLGVF